MVDLPPRVCRGVRGATVADADTPEDIHRVTRELLRALIAANAIEEADVASAIFTATPDLTSAYPATAARQIGWQDTALLSAVEIAPPGSLPRCIRILIHWNTHLPQHEIRHIYLRGAEILRPDRALNLTPAPDNSDSPTEAKEK